MATKPPLLARLKTALRRERRANTRLRNVIADLEVAVKQNRRDLDLQFTRIAQLQAELDIIKKRLW